MKKTLSYNLAACLLTAVAIFFSACKPERPQDDPIPEGMCAVQFHLGGAYPDIPALANPKTGNAPKADPNTYNNIEPLPLPEGSTLWLIHEMRTNNNWQISGCKSYVVVGSASGNALYPCQVDANGEAIPGTIEPSLYLAEGEYRFRAVSPARAWDAPAPTYGYLIDNGETLLANDERYNDTRAKEVSISLDVTGIQRIELNPLVNQTALIQFIISPGEGIHQLGLLPAGIELTGCQDIVSRNGASGGTYNWAAMNTGDTIIAYPGHKRGRTTVHDYVSVQEDTTISTINVQGSIQEIEIPAGSIIANMYVLPTDARSNSLVASFNIQMNGIPTYNTLYINRKIFQAGRSYRYMAEVSIQNGVTVFSWQNVQWNTDVEI